MLEDENNSLKEQIIALENALTESEKDEEVVETENVAGNESVERRVAHQRARTVGRV